MSYPTYRIKVILETQAQLNSGVTSTIETIEHNIKCNMEIDAVKNALDMLRERYLRLFKELEIEDE